MNADLLTTEEAAQRRKLADASTIRHYIRKGLLPAIKRGGVNFVRAEDVDALAVPPRGWPKGRPRRSTVTT